MKYIFLIIIAFLLVQEVPAQIRLSTMTEVTSLDTADLFWVNEYVAPNWVNRRLKWLNLRSNMVDYIDGLANTWALKQTFSSGATFSAGANGGVTFEDSVYNAGTSYLNRVYPTTSLTSQIGTVTNPYQTMWAIYYRIANQEGNDSVTISYDDSTLSFDKDVSIPNLNITESFMMDSAAAFRLVQYEPHDYTVPNSTDTILTLASADKYSFIRLDLPSSITSGISRLYVEGARVGTVVCFYTDEATFEMLFKDYVGNDDNIYMGSDFTMAKYDMVEFVCVVESIVGQTWAQRYRSDNN